MRAARVDACQPEIVEALRKCGCNVLSLAAVGKGCPDLLCEFRGRLYLLEVKDPKHGKLTPAQVAFLVDWGSVEIVRSAEQALRIVGAIGQETEI